MSIGQVFGPLLRLYEVKRWSMVEMRREQNVAEHTFAVMLIAEAIWQVLYPIEHNSDDHKLLAKWALYHDAEEYWTTDIPSPVKHRMRELGYSTALDGMIEMCCHQSMSEYLDLKRSVNQSIVEVIVKLADCAETLGYFKEYAVTPTGIVLSYLENNLDLAVKKLFAYAGNLHIDTGTEAHIRALINEVVGAKTAFVPNLMRVRHGLSYYEPKPYVPNPDDPDDCPF